MPFKKGHKLNIGNKYCKGIIPWNKGTKGIMKSWKKGLKGVGGSPIGKHWKNSEEFKEKCRKRMTGNKICLGIKQTKEHIEKVRIKISGKNNYKWIEDRTKVKGRQNRNNPEYKQWRYQIFKRDRHKCRINNCDCKGKVVAHHILPWKDYPEERYNINNGITLCQAHHPKRRIDEQRLISTFKELVGS